MSKTITIEDVIVKEANIAFVESGVPGAVTQKYVMNILYAQVDSDGNEYPMGWEPITEEDVASDIAKDIEKVLKHAKDKVKLKANL